MHDTDVGDLKPLVGLANLASLNLARTKVMDLKPVAKMKRLTWLGLNDTEVRDLSPLLGHPSLEELWLVGTRISRAQISALKQSLPNLKIEE